MRVTGLTRTLWLITRDTVIGETPASLATSLIVTFVWFSRHRISWDQYHKYEQKFPPTSTLDYGDGDVLSVPQSSGPNGRELYMRQPQASVRHAASLPAVALLALVATRRSSRRSPPPRTAAQAAETIKVGLITKDVTNPFFVKMKAGRDGPAKKLGAQLIYAAGKSSSDNASQIAAIENMTTAGVKGILITVADAKAENAAIAKARKAGVLVIALDSPTDPTTRHRRALRDEQLQRGRADRQVRAGRDEGQDGHDRDARRARRLVGRERSATTAS